MYGAKHVCQGDKCLARSKEYAQLNEIVSIIAMRKLYPIIMNYVNDRGTNGEIANGGKFWAETMLKAWTNDINKQRILDGNSLGGVSTSAPSRLKL